MKKVNVTVLDGSIEYGGKVFDTISSANNWIQKQVDNNSWGKPDRWELETDGTHTNTREVDNGLGETITEYFFPAEYTYEIHDITEQYNKDQARKAIFERRAAKRMLANNLMDILNDRIEQLNLNETKEDAVYTTFNRVIVLLQRGRPDKIKALIEAKPVGQIFNQETKDLMIDEIERSEL